MFIFLCTSSTYVSLLFLTLITSDIYIIASDLTYEQLRMNGHVEIENRSFLRCDYTDLYQQYDVFIDDVHSDNALFDTLTISEKQFVSIPYNSIRYCAAPPSFRDPSLHSKKINNRIYFQYIKEHFDLIKSDYLQLISRYPNTTKFLAALNDIDGMAKKHFAKILEAFEFHCPGIQKTFYGNNSDLTVVTKIVRYKQTENWHEKPHFDKSGLTLIWDNDDNHQSLMICDSPLQPTKNSLRLPERKYADLPHATSALLIAGLCIKHIDSSIQPTLHYVGPIKQEYRHSIISFLLIPNIDTSTMKSEFTEN